MVRTLRGGNPGSFFHWPFLLVLACLPAAACTSDSPLDPASELEVSGLAADALQLQVARAGGPNTIKATGSVEIEWPGGKGKVIPPGEEKLAFAEFEAFPATDGKAAKGSFTYRVLNPDLTPHREIVAVVVDAVVNTEDENEENQGRKAWFVAEVVSDTKICSGCGGHEPGEDGGEDGGCGGHEPGEDGGEDGGCGGHEPGEDGGEDGGCEGGGGSGGPPGDTGGSGGSGGHEPGEDGGDDGGCGGHEPGEDGGDDGGCGGHEPGEDGGEDGGCEGGSGGGHGGGGIPGIPGKDPRVGQFVVVKVHDKATPGAGEDGDGITWKWFYYETLPQVFENFPAIDSEPKKLCKKTIIGGNLVVHTGPGS